MPADDGILPGMAPRVGLWGLAASKPWFHAGEPFASIPPNAEAQWWGGCKEDMYKLMEPHPLERHVVRQERHLDLVIAEARCSVV